VSRGTSLRSQNHLHSAWLGHSVFIGSSTAAAKVRREIDTAARSSLNLLLTGETGVGKSLVAELVHCAPYEGAQRPFIVVEPAALPPTLFESEIFGHVKGAFTGAVASQAGAFESADGGTIFFDEMGDLPLPLQVKLLGAVEGKVVRRLGDHRAIHLNVRLIAATNRPLEQAVSEGKFRADLFERLNELRLHVPPLRERLEDIPLLLFHFLGEQSLDRRIPYELAASARELLTHHDWPGNVRELRNLARRLIAREVWARISEADLIPIFPARIDSSVGAAMPPEERIAVFSRRVYLDELRRYGFSIRQTARALGVAYPTFRSRLKSLELLEVVAQYRRKASSSTP
jgi:DNA-binding NtrC family response regulator